MARSAGYDLSSPPPWHRRRRAGDRVRRRGRARAPGGGAQPGADAVLCASIFHYGQHTVGEVKRYLAHAGIAVREVAQDLDQFRRPLSGFFYVTGRCASIAIRGGGDAGLVTARTAAGGRPLGPAPTNAGGGGVLQLFTHAVKLRRMRGTEASALEDRLLTVTSTSTTHRQSTLSCSPRSRQATGLRALVWPARSTALFGPPISMFSRPTTSLERRDGYWVVQSPSNPTFWWGNFLLFDDAPAAGDGDRWERCSRPSISAAAR